jgi:hypothetical protein
VEVVAYRVGMDWAVKWLQDRLTLTEREARKLGLAGAQTGAEWFDGRVAVQGRGAPASALIKPLREAGITVVELTGPALAESSGNFYSRLPGLNEKDKGHRTEQHPKCEQEYPLARTAGQHRFRRWWCLFIHIISQ